MKKEILVADNSGFCFGVKKAVDTALNLKGNSRIYTLGPIIHNNDVVNQLRKGNVEPIEEDQINNLKEGDTIIVRSHGIKKQTLDYLKNKKLNVINSTCPYVINIQRKVEAYYSHGYSIIIVGDKNHPEVIGINGWCEDEAIITKDGNDLSKDNTPRKVCVVSQTTEKQSNWEKALSIIIKYSKEIVALNTICSATEARQKNAMELSKSVDFMIVIGGKHSSNTTKLFEICKANCSNTILIENAKEIPQELLKNLDLKKVGITAGASTPNWIIQEVISTINEC